MLSSQTNRKKMFWCLCRHTPYLFVNITEEAQVSVLGSPYLRPAVTQVQEKDILHIFNGILLFHIFQVILPLHFPNKHHVWTCYIRSAASFLLLPFRGVFAHLLLLVLWRHLEVVLLHYINYPAQPPPLWRLPDKINSSELQTINGQAFFIPTFNLFVYIGLG